MKEKFSLLKQKLQGFCRKDWTFKVIPYHSRSAYTFHLKGTALLVIMLSVFSLGLLWYAFLSYETRLQASRVKKLEAYVNTLHQKISQKEKEKNEMTFLADKKYKKLEDSLKAKAEQIQSIWKVVGKKPVLKNSTRKSLTGSRGGIEPLKVRQNYYRLSQALKNEEQELKKLQSAALEYQQKQKAEARRRELAAIPAIYPCSGEVTSGFGWRGYEFHQGIDIADYYGSPINAAACGTVVFADYYAGYGYSVEIDHHNGYHTWYAHCSRILVNCGQRVEKGSQIAAMGATGFATGTHLHYEVRLNGTAVNPYNFLNGSILAQRTSRGE